MFLMRTPRGPSSARRLRVRWATAAMVAQSLTVNSAPGQQLVVYQADPGSPSEQALSLLGSLAADAAHSDEAADKNTYT
ncbi:hypothetical protein M2157_008616 [Streptomyces sp. SAI-127]|nr:hypothetical protein [Streptomyces sp. SAI-127]